MPEENTSLAESVSAAVTEHVKEEPVETQTAEEPKTETKPEESVAPSEPPADVEKIKHATALYDALVDPERRVEVVKYLMKQSGLDYEDKKDVKEAKKDTVSYLKTALGDTYSDFAEVLGPAFDTLLSQRLEEHTKPLKDQIESQQRSLAERQADAEMESLFSRHKVPKADRESIEAAMLAKVQRMPASGDITMSEYLDDIFYLVSRQKSESRAVSTTVDRINRNAKDGSRLSGVEIESPRRGSHLPTLDEAVKAGYKGEKFE